MSINDSALFVCYGLIFVIGILGNILVMIFFSFKMKRLTSYRLFIIHLAIADCVCSIIAPILYIYEVFSKKWQLGLISCKILPVIPNITVTVSAWILCGIAYERYRAIIYPLKRRFTAMFVHNCCLLLWISSILCFIPHYIELTDRSGHCRLEWKSGKKAFGITVFHFALQGIIPLFLMMYFFLHIYKASHAHTRIPIQTLFLTVTAFAVCFLPQTIFYMFALVVHLYYPEYSKRNQYIRIYIWLLVLLYLNSIINCFIYAGKFKQFRDYIGKFFGGKIDKQNSDQLQLSHQLTLLGN